MERCPTVGEVMLRDFARADPDESLASIHQTMRLARLRHIVVTRGDALLGLLTYRDLCDLLARTGGAVPERFRPADVMQTKPVTIGPEAELREAADLLCRYGLGCLPVVSHGGALLGLVTESGLLRVAFGLRAG